MAQPLLEFLTSQRHLVAGRFVGHVLCCFYRRLLWQIFASQVAMEQASMKGVEKSV